MTKSELQDLIDYFKVNAELKRYIFEYFDIQHHGSRQKISADLSDVVAILESYPTNGPAEDTCTEDALYDRYLSFKMAGFDPAQAFDLTRAFYENELQKRKE